MFRGADYHRLRNGGIAQLVERQLCKLEVRGSNPLASKVEGVGAKILQKGISIGCTSRVRNPLGRVRGLFEKIVLARTPKPARETRALPGNRRHSRVICSRLALSRRGDREHGDRAPWLQRCGQKENAGHRDKAGPAFNSRCAAKTELCVTVVFFLEPRRLSLSRSSRHIRR